jgi:hypothetical protein
VLKAQPFSFCIYIKEKEMEEGKNEGRKMSVGIAWEFFFLFFSFFLLFIYLTEVTSQPRATAALHILDPII